MSWLKVVDGVASGTENLHVATKKVSDDIKHGVIQLPEAYWRYALVSFAAVAYITSMSVRRLQSIAAESAGTTEWNLLPGSLYEFVYKPVVTSLRMPPLSNPRQLTMEAIQSATMISWGYGKGVYNVDVDVAASVKTSDITKIPQNQLKYMPHTSMFIGNHVNDCVGCFFSRIELADGRTALSFLMVKRGWPFIGDADPDFAAGTIDLAMDAPLDTIFSEHRTGTDPETFKAYVNLLLLCCCRNVEIRGRSTSTPGPSLDSNTKAPLVTPAPRLWDVAFREGAALRTAIAASASRSTDGGERQSPRAHMRRAHWHNFWAGTGDDRKLITHWIAPVLVGAVEDIVQTNHRI